METRTIYKKALLLMALPVIIQTVVAQTQSNALRIKITAPNNYYDETVVRFIDDATVSFDGNYDAWKLFSPNPDVPSLYTETPEEYPLSINSLPYTQRDAFTELFTWVNSDGDYLFEFEEVFPFDASVSIYLYDKLTEESYNLDQISSTTMHLAANVDSSARFELHFSYPAVTTAINESCYNAHDGSILLKDEGNADFSYELQDSNGQTISHGDNEADSVLITDLGAGSYVILCESYYAAPETLQVQLVSPDPIVADASADHNSVYLSDGGMVQFYNHSSGAASYLWDFGDGNTSTDFEPVHAYQQEGNYTVSMQASNGNCYETTSLSVTVIDDVTYSGEVSALQPFHIRTIGSSILLESQIGAGRSADIAVYDITGQRVAQSKWNMLDHSITVNVPGNSEGIYLVQLSIDNQQHTAKIYLSR